MSTPHAPTTPDEQAQTAVRKRALEPLFVPTWSLAALRPRLPFPFPVNPSLPLPVKKRYCSQYCYRGAEPLADAAKRAVMSTFEVALYLIDFSPLRRLLAPCYRPSAKGQTPFDPVSMFLACCLRRELKLSWRKLARLLAGEHGAQWRWLLGFAPGCTPSASGLRHFFNTVPPQVYAEFCPSFIQLLLEQNLCPQPSTDPADVQTRGVTCSEDGMLHAARQQHSCQLATDDCFRPLPSDQPTATRPCRAREHGLEGCRCDTAACQKRCQRASHLDPEARFIHYDGHNKRRQAQETEQPRRDNRKDKDDFGYRSIADRLLDDRFSVAWTLQCYLLPANAAECTGFPQRLAAIHTRFPNLKIAAWLADAALCEKDCLDAVYELRALRLIDIRADQSDDDPEKCQQRGYDGEGHPLCPHGYHLLYNGYDRKRRRAKWVCRQTCRRQPRREGETVSPVAGCPYLDPPGSLGQVINVGRALPDGCTRLAREIPYGSEEWQARYGRRNLSESRNSQMEGMGLKRMPSYGQERNEKEVRVADFLDNLRTLGRLVQEASSLHGADRSG